MGEEQPEQNLPEQQLMDKFSRQDELQVRTISLLEDIYDQFTEMPPIEVMIPQDRSLMKLVELMEHQQNIDFEPFTLTYPRNGTRLTIAAGTTTYDFLAGTVSAPGVDVADMGNSLMLQRKGFMRALTLNADQETVVRIGSSDKMPVRAGSFPLFPYRQFTTVEITVTETTEILISASTSSAAIIQMGGETSPSTHEFTGDVYENEHTIEAADGWDASAATYAQSFSVAVQETTPRGVFFSPTGLKMYVIGRDGDDVNEYDLGVAWDVSSAVYLQNFSVAVQETAPTGLFFSPTGLKMYVIGQTGDDVNEYDLGVAWDVSSAVWLQLFSVAVQETSPRGVFFSPTGLKMYVIGTYLPGVHEYDLGTAWDVSSAVYLQNFSVASEDPYMDAVFFRPDGFRMYCVGTTAAAVYQYSTAYRFETGKLLLRDVLIRVSTHDAVIGDAAQQRYPKAAGSSLGFTKVNLSKLYFANADPSNNTKINIFGVRL